MPGICLFRARTKIGRQMRSLANDRNLSALIIIPIPKLETIAWGIAGLLAGFTGLMFADLIRLEPTVITFMVIASTAVAICGRRDNLAFVLNGGLSTAVIENMPTLSSTLKDTLRHRRDLPPVVATRHMSYLWRQGVKAMKEAYSTSRPPERPDCCSPVLPFS